MQSESAMGMSGKVLVVEDDDGMREAIISLLDAAGIESVSYASAEALLACNAIDDACCVISDLKLPVMSGLELLGALRARVAPPPFIMITAHDAPGFRREAERLGAAAFLAKPFRADVLLTAVETVAGVGRIK